MTVDALTAILLIPAVSAAILALMPDYRLTARFNVAAALFDIRVNQEGREWNDRQEDKQVKTRTQAHRPYASHITLQEI